MIKVLLKQKLLVGIASLAMLFFLSFSAYAQEETFLTGYWIEPENDGANTALAILDSVYWQSFNTLTSEFLSSIDLYFGNTSGSLYVCLDTIKMTTSTNFDTCLNETYIPNIITNSWNKIIVNQVVSSSTLYYVSVYSPTDAIILKRSCGDYPSGTWGSFYQGGNPQEDLNCDLYHKVYTSSIVEPEPEPEPTPTSTLEFSFVPDDLDYIDDIGVIVGLTYHYETSTTTADWYEKHYFRWVGIYMILFIFLFFMIANRLLLELIIRWRK